MDASWCMKIKGFIKKEYQVWIENKVLKHRCREIILLLVKYGINRELPDFSTIFRTLKSQ